MPYQAIMNTPGYLPWADDEPEVFDTAAEAWAYLADARRTQEDDSEELVYSETVDALDARESSRAGEGVVYGPTPGNDSPHDLGIAYSVVQVSDK